MKIDNMEKPPTWVRIKQLKNNKRDNKIENIEESIMEDARINLEEPAIVHPFNTSILKIRNNGCVEGWTATDQGFRIDPNAKTFNIFADGSKEHINYKRIWAIENIQFWAKKGFLLMSEEGDYNLYAKEGVKIKSQKNIEINSEEKNIELSTDEKDIILNAQSKITIWAKQDIEIISNANINVNSYKDTIVEVHGDARISTKKTLNIDADKDININAGRNINIDCGGRTNIC